MNSKSYVKVEDLFKCETCKHGDNGRCYASVWCEHHEEYIPDIRKLNVTADVQEVRHGHWVLMERGHYFKCSECRTPIPYKFGWKLYNGVISNKRYYNFCPNCGAKMYEDATE